MTKRFLLLAAVAMLLGAGPATNPSAPASSSITQPANPEAVLAAAKARLQAAQAALSKNEAASATLIEKSPTYRAAKADMDQKESALAEARVRGSAQDRLDASSQFNAAKDRAAKMRADAIATDPDWRRLRDAATTAQVEVKKAEEAAKPKPLPTYESFVASIPADARPATGADWDEFTVPKAHKYLKQNIVGQRVRFSLPLRGVEIERIPKPNDPDETAGWQLSVSTGPTVSKEIPEPTGLWAATAENGGWHGGQLAFLVPEALALSAKSWQVGQTVQLAATVTDVKVSASLDSRGAPCGVITAVVRDVQITGTLAAPPSPRSNTGETPGAPAREYHPIIPVGPRRVR